MPFIFSHQLTFGVRTVVGCVGGMLMLLVLAVPGFVFWLGFADPCVCDLTLHLFLVWSNFPYEGQGLQCVQKFCRSRNIYGVLLPFCAALAFFGRRQIPGP